ncbi:MAG TPA: response regulator transcription factor [Jatrophihabitans sp.]|nr:response regulator transcription factor [Jatrophihabitans sp.]
MTIRIVIADQPCLASEVTARALAGVAGFDVLGISAAEPEIAQHAADRPTVLVAGTAATTADDRLMHRLAALHRSQPACPLVLLASDPTRALVDQAIRMGALSVVARQSSFRHLVNAVRGVAAGCLTLSPEYYAASGRGSTLTDRHLDVLRLTRTGAPLKQIAKELHLAEGTVRNLASAAIKALDGRNRFDAARIAADQGLF